MATALAEQVGIVFQILLAPSTLILGPDLLVLLLLNNVFCTCLALPEETLFNSSGALAEGWRVLATFA